MGQEFKLLSFADEKKLSSKELKIYFQQLRNYLSNTEHEGLSRGSLSICPLINPIVRNTLKELCGYDIEVNYECDINGLNAIYAHTHQSKMDHVNFIASNPNHTLLLNSAVLSNIYKNILKINGVYFVDKKDKISKSNAKLEMIRLALDEISITMFPESAWNLSPNKLHLPFYNGIVDIARKSGMPIVPVVEEYCYDYNSRVPRIRKVKVRYGNPIYVSETDDIDLKLKEYSEWISTTRWRLLEETGVTSRTEINNKMYIDFLKKSIKDLENAHIDVNVERECLFGATDEFYLFNHINAVDFNSEQELLPTEYVRKLEKIIKRNIL